MHLTTRNVNTAFKTLIQRMHEPGHEDGVELIEQSSWQGDTMMIPKPVYVTYTKPMERVLFNTKRNANPFFLLYEALWMLAGRDDVEPLKFYNSKIGSYSDDGRVLNSAYGKRWRHAVAYLEDTPKTGLGGVRLPRRFIIDQLYLISEHLKNNTSSRRAVLQMWDVGNDLIKIGYPGNTNVDIPEASKDVCCNLSICFSIRNALVGYTMGFTGENSGPTYGPVLDMTVFNRSNDILWGMLGSDYVCFSILQEYMAARIGIFTGHYHHITNNLHAYKSRWKPEKWLSYYDGNNVDYGEGMRTIRTIPLVKDLQTFDNELQELVELYSDSDGWKSWRRRWSEPFFNDVAAPLLGCYGAYKVGDIDDAYHGLADEDYGCKSMDWQLAARNWMYKQWKGI